MRTPTATAPTTSGLNTNDPTKGEVLHKSLQPFFETVNGRPLVVTKAVWGLTPLIQAVGLVNESAGKLARAFYGVCWSIVYTCYRPWAKDRHSLPDQNENKKTPENYKTLYNANEHFRFGMGTLVSAVYGGGALGMLYSWFSGNDELFDKSADVYQIGMFNQNQIFDSMNFADVLKRKFPGDKKLTGFDTDPTKTKIELTDSVLFIPNIITRGMDTMRLFGKEFSDGTQRVINTFSYLGYGTWAARYGLIKQFISKETKRGEGLLDSSNPKLEGNPLKVDNLCHDMQQYGGRIFSTILPGLSWLAAGTELLGMREVAQSTFKLEGILERLNPAIASWCIRNTWLNLFAKKPAKQETAPPVKKEAPTPTPPTNKLSELLVAENINWDEIFKVTKENHLWEDFVLAAEKGLIPLNILHSYRTEFPGQDNDPKKKFEDEGKDYWDMALEGSFLASCNGTISNIN